MKRHGKMDSVPKRRSQAGSTLIETMIAVTILLVCAAGVMDLAALALSTTEHQGHLMARTTEYCQDKMEQLLALSFSDSNSNTTVIPTTASGGTGVAIGGSSQQPCFRLSRLSG
jgi:Tfp pilus assembly protein PilV